MARQGNTAVRRTWRITINGTEACVKATWNTLKDIPLGYNGMKFLAMQMERGHETNRLHVQAYVEFSRGVRRSGVISFTGVNCDVRPADAGRQANVNYVTKEDTREAGTEPYRIGQEQAPGARNDILALRVLVDQGAAELALWDEDFGCMARNYQAIRQYSLQRAAYQDTAYKCPNVYVYWGNTKLGKTRRAVYESEATGELLFHADVPDKAGQSKWFDGYDGRSNILLDEYKGQFDLNWFKRFLDGYAMQIAIKGGYVPRRAKNIYITSNTNPRDWYFLPDATIADTDALRRRFTEVIHFVDPWTPPIDLTDAQPSVADTELDDIEDSDLEILPPSME